MNGGTVAIAVAGGLFAVGLGALVAKPHLIHVIIGLELLGKSASLVLITAGYAAGDTTISQAVVFTLIAIEAVVAAVALALVVRLKRTYGTMDIALIAKGPPGGMM
jgi:multisubunit Na+/H+ antiporter MnhC subunit